MPTIHNLEPFETGFSFDNCKRNAYLESKGYPMPTAQKTGTTIVGIVIKDGVILGADTRATEDTVVADKNSAKIHYLAKNMYCCGAGTAADTENVTNMVSSQLKLLRLNTGREVPVIAANRLLKQHLFKYQGYIGAALVLGGVDNTGPSIYCIHPHGSTEKSQYTAMGSGSLAAITHLESNWRPNMSIDEGKIVVRNAIASGVFNDLMSGNNIDMCIIQPSGIDYIRPYEVACMKGKRQGSYKYARGTTAVLQSKIKKIDLVLEDEQVITRVAADLVQPMDQSA